jgi:hypothetical protein
LTFEANSSINDVPCITGRCNTIHFFFSFRI